MLDLLSQWVHFLLSPANYFFLGLALICLSFLFFKRYLKLIIVFFIVYLTVITSPLPAVAYYFLENEYPRLRSFPEKQGLVILSGGTVKSKKGSQYLKYNTEVARILEGLRFFKLSGSKWLIVSEGRTSKKTSAYLSEGESFLKFSEDLGMDDSHIKFITNIKNTYEEAKQFSQQYKGIENFYLVTSAFHMPRAVAVFKKMGLKPTPLPVGHQVSQSELFSWKISNMFLAEAVMTEYAGFAAYKVLGRL
jgi:uncharacterized SAM-binding protein YcdF (DUF218 family)